MHDQTDDESQPYTSSWVNFAGYLMIIAGFFQIITGLVALLAPSVYLVTGRHLMLFDYNTWGWLHMTSGLVLVLSAGSLLAGKLWGRVVAIVFATLSAILNFGFIWASPFWAILIIILDLMIIYAAVVYGGQQEF